MASDGDADADHRLHEPLLPPSSATQGGDAGVDAAPEVVVSPEQRKIQRAIFRLYVSHAFSRWGNRMWEFAVAIFFMEICPSSLSLVALYGLMEAAAVAFFGSCVGRWVDRTSRISAVTGALVAQNAAILLAAGIVSLLLLKTLYASDGSGATSGLEYYALVVASNALGGVAALAALAETVSVERDWVVVLARESEAAGLPPGQLAAINTIMRRIDLTCKLVGPIAVGIVISAASALPAAILIASWNVLSIFVEFTMLRWTHSAVPALASKLNPIPSPLDVENSPLKKEEEAMEVHSIGSSSRPEATPASPDSEPRVGGTWLETLMSSWQIYARQSTFLPALSISLLYFTVLSFGTMMTAELTWRGVSAWVLSMARGAAAVTGLAGTVVYPVMEKRISALRTGLWAIWMQWAFLTLCVAGVFVSLNLGSGLLILGVIASRTGLWMFDLAVMQLMQEAVPESERGIVGGVHGSLQQFFNLACYGVCLVVSDPQDFWILILTSFCMVTGAALLYLRHCYTIRGHIFHFHFWFNKGRL